jgi:hypothetical protein
VLVPARIAQEYRGHLQRTVHPVISAISSAFRGTVLGTNLNWLTGNVVEAGLRALVSGAGVGSWNLGRRSLKELEAKDPEAALQARMATVAGGHYSLAYRNNMHTPIEKFSGDKLAAVARSLQALRRTPGPKHVADAWGAWTEFVFHTLNGNIETQVQTAMLGRALKRDPLMTKRAIYTSRKAVEEAANGLRNTPTQIRLGREIERMYGKYGGWSPGMRGMIAGYTPFVAWSLNAIRFLFDVLPRDHPVLTSLLASLNQSSADWRKSYGAFTDPFHVDKDAPPQFLVRGAIPAGGGFLRISRNTPFGIGATEGGTLASLASTLLPQFEGPINAAKGQDWKGDSLAGFRKTSPDALNALAVVTSGIESTIPLAGPVTQLAGVRLPHEAPTKQDKGDLKLRARKAFHDPFMVSKSRPPKRKGRTAGLTSLYSGAGSSGLYGGSTSGGLYGGGP